MLLYTGLRKYSINILERERESYLRSHRSMRACILKVSDNQEYEGRRWRRLGGISWKLWSEDLNLNLDQNLIEVLLIMAVCTVLF